MNTIKVGSFLNFTNFVNAVISRDSYEKLKKTIIKAKKAKKAKIICGGNYDDSIGYFIDPTIILTTDPKFETMETELYIGPIVDSIYIYTMIKII